MDAPDRVLEKLDEMRKNGKIDDYISKALNSIIESEKRAKQIISNYDYMNWLQEFIKNHNDSFYDDAWLYRTDETSKEDLKNVNMLSDFFTAIEMYANDNYYYPIHCDYGSYYLIEYNDKIYEIGCLYRKGTVFFANVLTEDKKGIKIYNCIDFKNICENNPNPWRKRISTNLDNFEKVIYGMLNDNVPLEAIIDKINTVIKAIEKDNKTSNN